MNYFDMFPIVNYNGVMVRDITRRTSVREDYRNNPYVFLPYTIQDGERAYEVAHYYYGNVAYTWVVYMSNNIIDPYYEWPLFAEDFDNYLIGKYSNQSGFTGDDVIHWTMAETNDDNIVYMVNVSDDNDRLSAESFFDPNLNHSVYRPVRIHEHETNLNEAKRDIHLIDVKHLPQLITKSKTLLRA